MTWFDLAHVTALWYMGPDPPSKKDLFLVSWVPWAGSLQLAALFGNCPYCRENLPKVTPLHGVANIQWPISARVQSCSLAHLRTTLKVISTLGLPPWHWPKLWLDLHYNSASPFLPLFYKCWSHCLFLINLLQVKPISVSESWKTQSETPHLPQFYLPTKTFLLQVPNKHRVEAAHFRWL